MGRKALHSAVPPKLPRTHKQKCRAACCEGNGLIPARLIRP